MNEMQNNSFSFYFKCNTWKIRFFLLYVGNAFSLRSFLQHKVSNIPYPFSFYIIKD